MSTSQQMFILLPQISYPGRISPFDWIIIVKSENVSMYYLSRIKYTRYDANFLIVYPIKGTYQILELYNVKITYDPFIKFYGTWNNQTGLIATNKSTFTRRINLQGVPLVLYTYNFKVHVSSIRKLQPSSILGYQCKFARRTGLLDVTVPPTVHSVSPNSAIGRSSLCDDVE